MEAAFFSGLRLDRRLILKAPKQGLPAIAGLMDAVPPGTHFIALKGVYGVNDAPNLWSGRHAQGMLSNGAEESSLDPRTLFWWFSEEHRSHPGTTLIGMVGTHVDDDLVAGNSYWKSSILPRLRKTFHYSKWADGSEPFIHLGRRVTQEPELIRLDQEEYALGLKQIDLPKERRKLQTAPATPAEISALRASNGRMAWLLKTRVDTAAKLLEQQQEAGTATVATVCEHNKLVVQSVRDSHLDMSFVPVRFWDPDFGTFAVSDSSFMNRLEDESEVPAGSEALRTEAQQGYLSLVGNEDEKTGRVYPVNVVLGRTHKARRKTRSTIGAECGAMSEGVNGTEMVRGYFAEILLGRPLVLRPTGYPAVTYEQDIGSVRMTAVTDCRSLYDNLVGTGKRPSEARLALDIGAIKEFEGIFFRWVRTQQMIADLLTKTTAPLYYVLLAVDHVATRVVLSPRREF